MDLRPSAKRSFNHHSTAVALARQGISQHSTQSCKPEMSCFICTSHYSSSLYTTFFVRSCSIKTHTLLYVRHLNQRRKLDFCTVKTITGTSPDLSLKIKQPTISTYFSIHDIQCSYTGDTKRNIPLKCRLICLLPLSTYIYML
jgi:hypothetical protein